MAWIELSPSAYRHNLELLSRKAGGVHRLAVVLKDNAYGHGLELIAQMAAEFGVRRAVVVNNDEADRLGERFEKILVLGDAPRIDRRCSYAVSEVEVLRRIDARVRIELKVDTGMHRNGIAFEELGTALKIIKSRGLHLTGVMSHYRAADELSSDYYWQRKRFEKVRKETILAGFDRIDFHSHNSAALLRCRNFDESYARVGIASYGYDPLAAGFPAISLKPVLSLWAKRMSTRTVRAGTRIGYGGEFTASRTMQVSTYDLGYGSGWPRGEATNPYKTPEGKAILGRVSMDFLSLEGEAQKVCIMRDARVAAQHFGTICYEMTTALMPTIPRILKEES
jgi:alanine racemase